MQSTVYHEARCVWHVACPVTCAIGGASAQPPLLERLEAVPLGPGASLRFERGVLEHRVELRVGGTDVAEVESRARSLAVRIREVLGDAVLGGPDATLSAAVGAALRGGGWTVGTAESCTAGLVAHAIAHTPGASDYLLGGVVSYANDVKRRVLGVDATDPARHGAVSEPVVRQMVRGAAALLGCDAAVATSGIAGPSGGTPDKPVGTVWIAVRLPDGRIDARRHRFDGQRLDVMWQATAAALDMLRLGLRSVARAHRPC